MTKRIVIDCDDHVGGCGAELHGHDEIDFTDHSDIPEGWGKVYAHNEHYCPSCWHLYCEDNDVNKKTGKYTLKINR